MSEFDLVVVGTGSSGTSAALGCAKAGWRIAVVDELPYGGTCELRGCDPKKVLVGAAELVDWDRRMTGSGIAGGARIDWPQLMAFKRTFTDPVPAAREAQFRAAGIATYHGEAKFTDATTLVVAGEPLHSPRIVLAAGARPQTLHLTGEEHLITSTGFLDLDRLPERIAFVGGGYIAFEFAHLGARAGAAPVVFQRGPRVLTGFEPSLVDRIVGVSASVGIDVRVNVDLGAVEKTAEGLRLHGTRDGTEFAYDCDLAVHAAGRVPDLDALALEAAGVERTPRGVKVNEYLQSTSNPAVYAVGDCADGGGLPLTPTAAAEGDLVARNLLEGNRYPMDFAGLASLVYTDPALGSAGLTEERARALGLRFAVREGDAVTWYSSRRVRARAAAYKILIEEGSGLILGAHVLSPHAEELINVFALAIRAKIPAIALGSVLFGYPTASSDIAAMLAPP
ncbi:MAG TPA: NAD(P)/FAD-dependent oxidoreductase [Candidatus Binatia bacterium]|nr:NAD(P)/FAD-dependent oxidoreductase [Candidatus Binatia bacterium]